MKLMVKKGVTSFLVCIFIQDSSSTTGAGLTGLTSGSSGLVAYRARADDGNAGGTAISLTSATKGTWTSAGFVEKDATNMPGVYELGIPNNALATGSDYCIIMLKGATNMAPVVLEIQLIAADLDDGVRLGLTALPNAAAGAAGGLPTDSTGKTAFNDLAAAGVRTAVGLASANLDTQLSAAATVTASAIRSATGLGSANLDTQLSTIAGYIDTEVGAIKAKTDNLPSSPASAGDVSGLLTTQLTEAYAANGVAPTLAQALMAIHQALMQFGISGTSKTVKKLDNSTTAFVVTHDSATAPTSAART